MIHPGSIADWFRGRVCLAVLGLLCLSGEAQGRNRQDPVNEFGWPMHDTEGNPINYDPEALAAVKEARVFESENKHDAVDSGLTGFVPSGSVLQPFWQYPVFGSNIGESNIIIAPSNGGTRPKSFLREAHTDTPFPTISGKYFVTILRSISTNRFSAAKFTLAT